jgi:hypothetical protein
MTVYLDDVVIPLGRLIFCHMWADTPEELHAMAEAIGLRREWFQEPPKASWHHYDVPLDIKADALARGAVLTDRYGPVEYVNRLTLASGDPGRAGHAAFMLRLVAKARARAP